MTQELREVVRAMFWQARNSSADIEDLTDAAIALCMEEAAKVADENAHAECGVAEQIAAAIRALKEETP